MKTNNFELARRLRRELHQNPELSNHEYWTKKHLMNFLNSNTSLEVVDKGKWFYALYKSEKGNRNLAFRADIDAIKMDESMAIPHASKNPGVSHKCGHDGHSASLAGFALEIDQNGSDNNIFFLFQHAEETGDGAAQCVEFIEENKIDEIYAYHNMSGMPYNSVNIKDGTINCASKGMTIHLEGAPSHASEPEKGKNPALALSKIVSILPELTSPAVNKGMVLCTVIQIDLGEKAFGVSASKGDLRLTIRALYEDEMDKLQYNIEKMTLFLACHYGLDATFSYNDSFPETTNHDESSAKIRQAGIDLGLDVFEMPEAFRGSEDFGHYLKETKGAICYIGNGTDYPHVHSHEYDFPDELIRTAVKLFKRISEM